MNSSGGKMLSDTKKSGSNTLTISVKIFTATIQYKTGFLTVLLSGDRFYALLVHLYNVSLTIHRVVLPRPRQLIRNH